MDNARILEIQRNVISIEQSNFDVATLNLSYAQSVLRLSVIAADCGGLPSDVVNAATLAQELLERVDLSLSLEG